MAFSRSTAAVHSSVTQLTLAHGRLTKASTQTIADAFPQLAALTLKDDRKDCVEPPDPRLHLTGPLFKPLAANSLLTEMRTRACFGVAPHWTLHAGGKLRKEGGWADGRAQCWAAGLQVIMHWDEHVSRRQHSSVAQLMQTHAGSCSLV